MRTAIILAAAVAVATPAVAENWHAFSRSATMTYLTDVDSIVVDGEITSITMARISRRGEAGDQSHEREIYQFRCAAGQWKSAGVKEFAADGTEAGSFADEMDWEPVSERGIAGGLKGIACDGARANPPHFPSLTAWIEAGRP